MSDLVTAYEIPAAGSAEVSVLHNGYVGLDGDGERVSGSHHPDHTVNAALFPNARIHDHWAIYQGADQAALVASRERLISFADVVIPGHGAPFRPRKSA
jgi:hypothetical protein